jgi:hypothetical protein
MTEAVDVQKLSGNKEKLIFRASVLQTFPFDLILFLDQTFCLVYWHDAPWKFPSELSMWVNPTPAEPSSLWITEQENEAFLLQRYQETGSKTMLKNLWATVQTVFEQKQPPFRIVFRMKSLESTSGQMVAVCEGIT